MKTTNIYTLKDPITKEIRYVGKTNNINQRFKAHLNGARKHQIHKKNWIKSLKNKGLKPIVEVLDVVPIEEWIFWETFWISQMKSWGYNLINYTNGGDGCTFANQTSFKKGHGSKMIVCLNKKGEFINEFLGIPACEKFCGKKGVDGVLSKRRKTAGSYFFIYKDEYSKMSITEKNNLIKWINKKRPINSGNFIKGVPSKTKGTTGCRLGGLMKATSVLQFDLNDNLIEKHYSVREVAKKLNCSEESIRNACVKKSKTSHGYKWKYER